MSLARWFLVSAIIARFDLLSNSIFVFGTFAKKLLNGLSKLQRRFHFSMGANEEKNDEKEEKIATFLFNFWRAFLKKTLFCCFLMIKLNSESDFSGTLTLCIGFLGVPF